MSRLAQLSPYLIQRSTPSAVATLDFVIPSTTSSPTGPGIRAVRLYGWLLPATDNVEMWIRLSNDGGATYRAGASDYAWAEDFNQLVGGSSVGTTRDDADSEMRNSSGIGNVAGEGISFNMTVLNPLNAARRTAVLTMSMVMNTSTQEITVQQGGSVLTAEINNAIRLMFSSGNIASGEVSAYGIY